MCIRTIRLLAIILSLLLPGAGPDNAGAQSAPPRSSIGLNDGWRFHLGQVDDAQNPGFDDTGWSRVDLPHTWNAADGQDGGGDYHRGVGWYRRSLELSNIDNRRVFIRFGAANSVADVYYNGTHLGQHRGGYSAFCYELTHVLDPAGPHVLAVRVDNRHYDDVVPYSADYTFFGGIYRDVELVVLPRLCISPLDHASSGVYLTPGALTAESARVEVATVLSNGTTIPVACQVRVAVHDMTDRVVARDIHATSIPALDHRRVTLDLTIPSPRRWRGRRDPYLYQVHVEVIALDRVMDRIVQPLGLRAFRVDPRQGFVLNGVPYDLHGVNRHQDRENKGWAIARADHDEDMAMIADLGCTMVRLAHYQHDDYVYDLCDRRGLVVWAEIPLINRITDHPDLAANCRQQLTELIRQNYNHPSICFWGIHNEITAPWLKERGPDPAALIGELHALAKAEDPGRLTVCAATDPVDHPANWHTDVTAFNRYFGWYGGTVDDIGGWIDELHQRRGAAVGISEYGAGGSLRQHQWPPAMPKHDGPFHPEEYQALFHERHWQALSTRPHVWCKLVWNMFDFASDGRAEGAAPGINDKGLVSYDRKTTKDAFHWYRANWKRPMVYISGRRLDPRPVNSTPVRVYSNCDEVVLYDARDGKAAVLLPIEGRRTGKVIEFDFFGRRDRLEVRAVCGDPDAAVQDRCTWTVTSEDPIGAPREP